MTFRKGTYYKALLLLVVFSLNTVVSFACSFSSFFHGFHHHNASELPSEHSHSSNHHHQENKTHKHQHEDVASHQHESEKSEENKDDCCSTNVVVLEKAEKAISKTIEAPTRGFLTSLVYCYSYLSTPLLQENKISLFAGNRWRALPTIQDLRIVIQSFQI